ncbi:MAG: NADH-quinone oxidoreductase subunit L [Solirubrobacterales bacterium]
MALIVTGVSFLIHLSSVAYMAGDPGYRRFFSYLNFFVFSMLLLVLAGNFALLIVGWAFVGFASYALISFWYRRRTAVEAGMKAFVINVVGDVGLVLGSFLIVRETGTLDFLAVFEEAEKSFAPDAGTLVAALCLMLVGAFAKSAQLPLHTWLPDAMEGPTPVSALIHAATMVTAGVYLIARLHPLFELAPTAADIAAFIGLATLLVAATIALVVNDLKRIIAYSTMSQIGYMVVAVSIGAHAAGMFHLMTHAFFKALLFMCAGSVIAAMAHVQDIDRMSGFRKAMPFTFVTFLIGALALAGFPFTSGFFSKDEILVFASERHGIYTILALGGYAGALLTAAYSFRMVFRVFFGPECEEAALVRQGEIAHPDEIVNPATGETEDHDVGFPGPDHHIAERNWPMKVAMGGLAAGALFAGFLQFPGGEHVVETFLEPSFEGSKFLEIKVPTEKAVEGLIIGGIIALIGIAIAYVLFLSRWPSTTDSMRERLAPVHRFLSNRWYFDEAIEYMLLRPVFRVGAWFRQVFESTVVDGLVNGTTSMVRGAGGMVRETQSGFLRSYALLLLGGFAGLGLYFLVVSG